MHTYHLGEIASASVGIITEGELPLLDEEFDSFNVDTELYSAGSGKTLSVSVENIF